MGATNGDGCPRNEVPADISGAADHYDWYAKLRATAPVVRVRQESGLEVYLVTRYEDARQVMADPRMAKDPRHGEEALAAAGVTSYRSGVGFGGNMLTADPPQHTRLRRLVSAEFTPHRVAMLRPRIQELADRLAGNLADALASGPADLVSSFAFPLPCLVICELLGVPLQDHERFQELVGTALLPHGRSGQAESARTLNGYLAELIARKRVEPDDGLLSALLLAQDQDRLTEQEVLGSAMLLLVAGFETTANLIGNGTLALLLEPGAWPALAANPDRLPAAVEELLRYDGPVERTPLRFATTDVDLGGVTIPAGCPVSVVLVSADRDDDRFAEADRLDLDRADNRHLAFGHGLHYCLGAPLARLEAEIAFGTLLRAFPTLTIAEPADQLRRRESLLVRGVVELPVTLD